MAERKRSLPKNRLFLGIASLVVLAVIVIIMIVVNSRPNYNDEYFVSDDSKIVLSMQTEPSEDGKTPTTTYVVYYNTGDKITGLKQFYKFDDEAKAKEVFDELDTASMDWVSEKELNGHFIIFTIVPSEYEGLTTDIVRSSIETNE